MLRAVAVIGDLADRVLWWLGAHRRESAGALALVAVVVVAAVVLTRGGGDPAIPSSAVAMVDGTPVTAASLTHWEDAYRSSSTAGAKPTAAQAKRSAFQLLVLSTWLEQEAVRRGVRVTPAQVDDAVRQAIAQYQGATKQQVLAQLGTTEPDLRVQERVALLASALEAKVRKRVPPPTPQAIAAAYRSEPARWARPSKRDLRVVITAQQAGALAAAQALNAGTSFKSVSSQYNTDTQLVKGGGVLKDVQPGTNEPAFERAVFSAPQGKLQGPVQLKRSWVVFKVQQIRPLPAQSLAAATPAIRKDLTTTSQQKAVDAYLSSLRAHWRARTRCVASVRDQQYCAS
jgi:parvulin-like peptidyl-prolyl isomerase